MSYDTTVNDALDPPEARIAARERGAARWWKLAALAAIAILLVGVALSGWLLL